MKKIALLVCLSLLLASCGKEDRGIDKVITTGTTTFSGMHNQASTNTANTLDMKGIIADYYGISFLKDSYKIDTKEKCTLIKEKFSNLSSDVDCNNYSDQGNFGDIILELEKLENNFYSVNLYENYLGGSVFINEIYDTNNGKTFFGTLSGGNLGAITIPNEKASDFGIRLKEIQLSDNLLHLDLSVTHDDIGDFKMFVDYTIKNNLEKEKITGLLQGMPYKIIEGNRDVGMGFDYRNKITKEGSSSKILRLFGKNTKYIGDPWTNGDIFITATDTPENQYFSQIAIYFLHSQSFENKENEEKILKFLESLGLQNNFIIN